MRKLKISIQEVARLLRPLSELPPWLKQVPPVHQQICLLRKALGMTQAQLARRLGIRQSAVAQFELKSNGELRLDTLAKMADAMNCELVTSLVPREDLEKFLDKKAEEKARQLVQSFEGSNAIELQSPGPETREQAMEATKRQILEKNRAALWD